MRAFLRLGLLASFTLTAGLSAAASATPSSPPTRVSPSTRVVLEHWARTGQTFPMFVPNTRLERSGRLPVVVDFARPPSGDELGALERSGVRWERDTALVSGAHLASVDARGLAALDAAPNVARVANGLRVRAPLPLDASAKETGIAKARRAVRAKDGTLLDGTGTIIGDVDTDVWIFHPALFRADGGTSRWVDVDKDGKLTPDVDGVDLDGSGTIEKEEILHVVKSRVVDPYKSSVSDVSPGGFAPDSDFLYCDTNGNGARDYGADFSEDTPAYGEPLFVFDDANANGRTETSERVLRLATSKIKAVKSGTKTYVRGGSGASALVKYDLGKDARALYDAHHGTSVAGILVSGNPSVSRWLGLAPGAELVVGAGHDSGTAAELQWAVDQGANVLLTEYAPFVGIPLDGTSPDDAIIDAAFAKGILTVSPAGNLAISNKHRTVQVASGTPTSILVSPRGNANDVRYMALSIYHHAPGRKVSLKLTRGAETIDLPEASTDPKDLADGAAVVTYGDTTKRGTAERHVSLYKQTPLGGGDVTITISVDAGTPVEMDLYVVDEMNGWSQGFQFDQNVTTRTICEPATADKTISVAAYTLHADEAARGTSKEGELATYSSRGPLIDGKTPGIAIAAPDNPYTLLPPAYEKGGIASYWAFGGTSGAGPHVAATLALLRQLFPKEPAEQLKARLLASTRHDGFAKEGALSTYGNGKLDALKASGLDIADGEPPKVTIELQGGKATTGGGATFDAKVTDDGDKAKLSMRWDFDYDGTPDTDWEPLAAKHFDTPTAGLALVNAKVEVRDDQGNVGAATVVADVVEGQPDPPPGQATAPTETTTTEDGCGCRQAPMRGSDAAMLGVVAAAVGMLLRRRRR